MENHTFFEVADDIKKHSGKKVVPLRGLTSLDDGK